MLHRSPNGVTDTKIHQKRLPAGAPPWVQTVRVDASIDTAVFDLAPSSNGLTATSPEHAESSSSNERL
jgi:DNA primase